MVIFISVIEKIAKEAEQVREILMKQGTLEGFLKEMQEAKEKDKASVWINHSAIVTAKMYNAAGITVPNYIQNQVDDAVKRGFKS